jgi:UDP-N-acetylglucosamine 2-epimerase (non-hydrolysing)
VDIIGLEITAPEWVSFILTDSGGIQEEAPALGKPVLVMGDVTERPEAGEAGVAKIVGTHVSNIVQVCHVWLTNLWVYQGMSRATSPYGDGKAAKRIAGILLDELS